MNMSLDSMWRKADESDYLHNLSKDDELCDLYYCRIYTTGKGYEYSDTNQYVLNLKIQPVEANSSRLGYKSRAIDLFVKEATEFLQKTLQDEEPSCILVPIPPSKSKDHDEYDNRIELVAKQIALKINNFECIPALYTLSSRTSAHTGGQRNVESICKSLAVDTNLLQDVSAVKKIFLLDDVLTSGANFSAAKKRILEHLPGIPVVGIFWARAKGES
jgi:hypothetical protein